MKTFKTQAFLFFAFLFVICLCSCSGSVASAPNSSLNISSIASENIRLTAENTTQNSAQTDNFSPVEKLVQNSSQPEKNLPDNINIEEPDEVYKIEISTGDKIFSAKLYDNESAKTISAKMPFTLTMEDFAGQEKVAPLKFSLPNASTQTPDEIRSGEIYLWSGDQLVLFYTSFSPNPYSYVPVGYIEDITGLTQALGSSSVEITFSVKQ